MSRSPISSAHGWRIHSYVIYVNVNMDGSNCEGRPEPLIVETKDEDVKDTPDLMLFNFWLSRFVQLRTFVCR